jgi:hypothetical protein
MNFFFFLKKINFIPCFELAAQILGCLLASPNLWGLHSLSIKIPVNTLAFWNFLHNFSAVLALSLVRLDRNTLVHSYNFSRKMIVIYCVFFNNIQKFFLRKRQNCTLAQRQRKKMERQLSIPIIKQKIKRKSLFAKAAFRVALVMLALDRRTRMRALGGTCFTIHFHKADLDLIEEQEK